MTADTVRLENLQRNVTMRASAVPPNEEKRPFIQKLFTSIAPRYDWFNRLASCGLDQSWRRKAVKLGEINEGLRVLDVCAGTGDLSLLSAQRVGSRGSVVGLDFNQAMLAAAKRKTRQSHLSWAQGDAQKLPFADGIFDRVTIGFSTRNLSDLRLGLGEMLRVLRPGGRLVILETGRPANAWVRFGYYAFLATVVRVIGFLLTGRLWPFTYLAKSVQQFITPQEMVACLQGLGAQAAYVPLSGGLASLFLAAKPRA